jgi:methylsterol monooxygenase
MINATSTLGVSADMGLFEAFWRGMTAQYSTFTIAVFGSFILHTIVYFVFTAMSIAIAFLPFLEKYKIQKNRVTTWNDILRCFGMVQFTHCLLELPLYFIMPVYYAHAHLPMDYESIAPWYTYIPKMFACLVLEDTWHYWCHRALHHKSIYGAVHKIHHFYTAPFGMVAEYAHPVETVVLGFGFFIPIGLLSDHALFIFLWFLVRQVQTHEAHLGYRLPFNPLYLIPFYGGAEAHDLHHKTFECNYSSTFTWWDRIGGTYEDPAAYYAKNSIVVNDKLKNE